MGDREVADVQNIEGVAAAVGALADAQEVVTLAWGDGGERGVLGEQGVVVAGRDHEPLGIHKLDMRIEHLLVEPHRIDDGCDPFARPQMHLVDIDVFIFEPAPHRPARLERCGLGEGIVGLLLRRLLGRMHVEHSQFGEAAARAHSHAVRAERAVGGHGEFHRERLVVFHGGSSGGDASLLEEDLSCAVEFGAGYLHVDRGTLAGRRRLDAIDRGLRPRRSADDSQRQHHRHGHQPRIRAVHQRTRTHGWMPPGRLRQARSSFLTLPPSTISTGRLPGATSSLSATMPRQW